MPGGAEILTERLGQGGQSVSENSASLLFIEQMSVAVEHQRSNLDSVMNTGLSFG